MSHDLVLRTLPNVAVAHSYITVNGVELHCATTGDPTAPAVVLLHGFPEHWMMWRHVMPLLRDRFHLVAVDLRGYGASSKPAGVASYAKGIMAADIAGVIAALGLRRPLVVGHDRGARVARRLALDAPEVLRGSLLLDILPAEWIYDHLTAAQIGAKLWHWVFHLVPDLPEQLITGREDQYLARLFQRSPAFVEQLRTEGVWESYLSVVRQPEGLAAMLADYRATFAIDVPYYRGLLVSGTQITLPIRVLWGERGNLAGLPVLEVWRECASEVSGQAIPDCGHYLPEEAPMVIAQAIADFDQELRAKEQVS